MLQASDPVFKQTHLARAYGELVVVDVIAKLHGSKQRTYFKCRCSCGVVLDVRAAAVINGNSTTCGAGQHRYVDLVGEHFGRLVVVARVGLRWRCRCECGTFVIKTRSTLQGDKGARSCGCLKKEYHSRKSAYDYQSKEYRTWSQMQQRCYNPKNPSYMWYGALGIRVEPCWRGKGGFGAFIGYVGPAPSPEHSINRPDPTRNYGPGNAKWSLTDEQARDRRPCGLIAYNGIERTLAEWARAFDVNYHTLYQRINAYGMSFEEAITRPFESKYNGLGKKQTKEYRTWAGIKNRCHNRNSGAYQHYGAAGIVVCEEWRESFDAFLAYMGSAPTPKHTIDRIDNTRGYEPGNCRWATRKEQAANRRGTIILEYNGRRMSMSDWARTLGMSLQTFRYGIRVRNETIVEIIARTESAK